MNLFILTLDEYQHPSVIVQCIYMILVIRAGKFSRSGEMKHKTWPKQLKHHNLRIEYWMSSSISIARERDVYFFMGSLQEEKEISFYVHLSFYVHHSQRHWSSLNWIISEVNIFFYSTFSASQLHFIGMGVPRDEHMETTSLELECRWRGWQKGIFIIFC